MRETNEGLFKKGLTVALVGGLAAGCGTVNANGVHSEVSKSPSALPEHHKKKHGTPKPTRVGVQPLEAHGASSKDVRLKIGDKEVCFRGLAELNDGNLNYGDPTIDPIVRRDGKHTYLGMTTKSADTQAGAITVHFEELKPGQYDLVAPRPKNPITACAFKGFAKFDRGDADGITHYQYVPSAKFVGTTREPSHLNNTLDAFERKKLFSMREPSNAQDEWNVILENVQTYTNMTTPGNGSGRDVAAHEVKASALHW